MTFSHTRTTIKNNHGLEVNAVAPVIISASRATDIPAFYAKWFFKRFEKGYCAWINPFNRQKQYISFRDCRVVVFWTKNPQPILPYLHILDELGINYYFQYTLNDYEKDKFEPNLPPLVKRIAAFKDLAERIGPERVVWRYDPVIFKNTEFSEALLARIANIGKQLQGHTHKLVFSFVDVFEYRKVQNNLVNTEIFKKQELLALEGTPAQRIKFIEGLLKIRDSWHTANGGIVIASCAEEIDLAHYGIAHNRCVDDELMRRIFVHDKPLMKYLNVDASTPAGQLSLLPLKPKKQSDNGQRKLCGCIPSKDIGAYNTCPHFCVYCYANASQKLVKNNIAKHSFLNESIV